MALRGYLSLPDIEGESVAQGHEGEIDVWGLDWGIEAPDTSTGRFRRRARPDPRPWEVFKFWDKSSVYVADAVARGKVFDEVVLTVRKDSGDAHLDYLVITMTNVLIVDYDIRHTDPKEIDERIVERYSLAFEKIQLTHIEPSPTGAAGAEHEVEIADGRA